MTRCRATASSTTRAASAISSARLAASCVLLTLLLSSCSSSGHTGAMRRGTVVGVSEATGLLLAENGSNGLGLKLWHQRLDGLDPELVPVSSREQLFHLRRAGGDPCADELVALSLDPRRGGYKAYPRLPPMTQYSLASDGSQILLYAPSPRNCVRGGGQSGRVILATLQGRVIGSFRTGWSPSSLSWYASSHLAAVAAGGANGEQIYLLDTAAGHNWREEKVSCPTARACSGFSPVLTRRSLLYYVAVVGTGRSNCDTGNCSDERYEVVSDNLQNGTQRVIASVVMRAGAQPWLAVSPDGGYAMLTVGPAVYLWNGHEPLRKVGAQAEMRAEMQMSWTRG